MICSEMTILDFDPMVGVEIELENCCSDYWASIPAFNMYWELTHDGSLRGDAGVEFRFKGPYNREQAELALKKMGTVLMRKSVYKTPRCSTHVHIDMTPLAARVVVNVIGLSLLMEPVLYLLVDPRREQSVFCKPSWEVGSSVYSRFGHVLDGQLTVQNLCGYSSKYSGINLLSYQTHGSLEFRMAPAPNNHEEVIDWVRLLVRIHNVARSIDAAKGPADWFPTFIGHYQQNVKFLLQDYEVLMTQDKMLEAESKAMSAFKMISYYGGF